MLDFAEWTRGVSAFLRGLTRLPGRIDIMDAIEPPADNEYDREWLDSEKCSLPSEIRCFVCSASRRCCFRYEWSPPPEYRHRVSALFPNQQTLIGGGDFCEAAKYSNYYNRDWFARSGVAGMFGLAAISGRMEPERCHGRVPLMEFPNGDVISLQLLKSNGARPVVYVAANTTAESQVLSTSFQQFLLDWQRLSYIQPTLEFLSPWIDSASGQLNPDSREADVLTSLLLLQ